jgi:hypothetical protein
MIFYEIFESLTYSIQYEKYKCTRLQSERNLEGQRGTKIGKNGGQTTVASADEGGTDCRSGEKREERKKEKRGREKESRRRFKFRLSGVKGLA